VRYFKNRVGTQTGVFVRTRFTWLAYILLGYYAYLQASVGPLMPFLRSELHMSYTLEGLHHCLSDIYVLYNPVVGKV
jgi:hypothetical protein